MSNGEWAILVDYAREWLVDWQKQRYDPWHPAVDGGVGVYIAMGFDGKCEYVGSTYRPLRPDGIRRRIREHEREKRMVWEGVWVLRIRASVAQAKVLDIEGGVSELLEPRQEQRRAGALVKRSCATTPLGEFAPGAAKATPCAAAELRALRSANHLTQAEAATLLGTSRGAIASIEQGLRTPSPAWSARAHALLRGALSPR